VPLVLAAGYFIGFYTNRFDPDLARDICAAAGVGLICASAVAFPWAKNGQQAGSGL
jgi:hypothetical protein